MWLQVVQFRPLSQLHAICVTRNGCSGRMTGLPISPGKLVAASEQLAPEVLEPKASICANWVLHRSSGAGVGRAEL